jgi:hypothetical protein
MELNYSDLIHLYYIYTIFLINISSSSGRRHRWAVPASANRRPIRNGLLGRTHNHGTVLPRGVHVGSAILRPGQSSRRPFSLPHRATASPAGSDRLPSRALLCPALTLGQTPDRATQYVLTPAEGAGATGPASPVAVAADGSAVALPGSEMRREDHLSILSLGAGVDSHYIGSRGRVVVAVPISTAGSHDSRGAPRSLVDDCSARLRVFVRNCIDHVPLSLPPPEKSTNSFREKRNTKIHRRIV